MIDLLIIYQMIFHHNN